jgi:hypothetical protein
MSLRRTESTSTEFSSLISHNSSIKLSLSVRSSTSMPLAASSSLVFFLYSVFNRVYLPRTLLSFNPKTGVSIRFRFSYREKYHIIPLLIEKSITDHRRQNIIQKTFAGSEIDISGCRRLVEKRRCLSSLINYNHAAPNIHVLSLLTLY